MPADRPLTPDEERLLAERAFARKEGSDQTRARERVLELLDPGSFLEVGTLARDGTHGRGEKTPSDGIVAGYGTVDGHRVGVISLDGTVLAGSGGKPGGAKQQRIVTEAERLGFPLIAFGEGGGGRIPDMMGSSLGVPHSIGEHQLLVRLGQRDRRFPLFSCSMGEMYGDPSFKFGLADFPIMAQASSLGISGPRVIEAALGEIVSGDELGGSQVHARNGQAIRVEETEADVIATVKRILDFVLVPLRESGDPIDRATPEIADILPANYERAYNVRKVAQAILDQDCAPLELWPEFGTTAVAMLGRLGGRTVAVFANQSLVRGGVLDDGSVRKASKLLRRCDRFNIPILYLHDVPGFMIGRHVEAEGILGTVMQYISDMASSPVPKISLVLRKSYGMAYFAMGGQAGKANYIAALTTARIAFMGPEAGINLVYAKKLAGADDAERVRAELTDEWSERAMPWEAAHTAAIDDVILPSEARQTMLAALRALA